MSTQAIWKITSQEKILYHQIHPLKLTADILADIISLYFFWEHKIFIGLLILLLPPVLATLLLTNFSNLEKLKYSAFGHYVKKYMGPRATSLRVFGLILAVISAYTHLWSGIVAGHMLIIGAWAYGLIF